MKLLMNKLSEIVGLENLTEACDMSKFTSFRAGGKADILVQPQSVEQLKAVLQVLAAGDVPYMVMGNGSNILVKDTGYKGVIVKLGDAFNSIDINGTVLVAGCGTLMSQVAKAALDKSLTGFEFASGIPGSLGGAVFMNAGAYKTDMGYIVESVKVLTPDFKVIKLENKEMDFHYRTSFLQKHRDYICLEVVLKLAVGKREAIEEVIKERRIRREESQPLEYPSAGSVFRNPPDNFAGKLVEDCGLKGLIKGGAMISDKHANFIINYKDATSDDVKYLIDLAHDKVLEEYGIDLKVEQEFVNWD